MGEAKERIDAWRAEHPEGTQTQCIKEGVASRAAVYKHWPAGGGTSKKEPAEARRTKMPANDKTERMTFTLSPERKKQLRYLCVDDDVSVSDWIDAAVARAWEAREKKGGI